MQVEWVKPLRPGEYKIGTCPLIRNKLKIIPKEMIVRGGADRGLVSWGCNGLPRQRSVVVINVKPTTFTMKDG